MNLTILLLSSRRYLPKSQIRTSIEGYRDQNDAAFERMFERDKDDLRAMGVPVETGSNELLFDDDEGYRIRRGDFELPPMEFTAAEAAVLGLAAQVWQQASSAESTTSALTKLRAAGLDPDTSRLAALQPSMNAPDAAFDVIRDGLLNRQAVRFRYRDADELRTVEPWLLPFRNGAWYLIGLDRTRGERRTFKLSRVSSVPTLVGRPGAYQVPEKVDASIGVDVEAETHTAVVAVRSGHAPALTRRGDRGDQAALPEHLTGFEVWSVPFVRTHELVGELAASAPNVVVLSPDHVIEAHLAHLQGVLSRVDLDRVDRYGLDGSQR